MISKSIPVALLVVSASCLATACGGSPAEQGESPAPVEVAAADVDETPAELTGEPWPSLTEGALTVLGDTNDWFDVTRDGERATSGAPPMLNTTVELPPGSYQISVNNTRRTVSVAAGEQTVLRTGTLVVEGTEANFWAPYLGEERLVVANPPTLNSALALFPGTYRVELNVAQNRQLVLGEAAVLPGRTTTLHE